MLAQAKCIVPWEHLKGDGDVEGVKEGVGEIYMFPVRRLNGLEIRRAVQEPIIINLLLQSLDNDNEHCGV